MTGIRGLLVFLFIKDMYTMTILLYLLLGLLVELIATHVLLPYVDSYTTYYLCSGALYAFLTEYYLVVGDSARNGFEKLGLRVLALLSIISMYLNLIMLSTEIFYEIANYVWGPSLSWANLYRLVEYLILGYVIHKEYLK